MSWIGALIATKVASLTVSQESLCIQVKGWPANKAKPLVSSRRYWTHKRRTPIPSGYGAEAYYGLWQKPPSRLELETHHLRSDRSTD